MNDIDNYDFNPDTYCPEDDYEPGIDSESLFERFRINHLTFREHARDAVERWDLHYALYNFYH